MLRTPKIVSSLCIGILLAWIIQTELLLYRPVYKIICEQVRIAGPEAILLNADLLNMDPAVQRQESIAAGLVADTMSQYLAGATPARIPINCVNAYYLYFSEIPNLWVVDLGIWLSPATFYIPQPSLATTIIVDTTPRETYDANAILLIWGQIILLAIFTIWARTVGPRFRPDQLSDLTWKDLLLFLLGLLILAITIMQ